MVLDTRSRNAVASLVLTLALVTSGVATTVAISTPATAAVGDSYTVTVTDVTDGDTVTIRFQNGTTETVRLLGVDTPEVYAENTPDEFEGVPDTNAGTQCLGDAGDAASSYTEQRLTGETVTFQFDTQADSRGYYGRLLGYIVVDGQNFNRELVDSGNARVYDSSFSYSSSFYAAETDAQNAQRGLWSCRDAGGSVDLSITTIHADASGNDNYNLNDEYVTIENTGSSTADLGGFTVSDEAGKTYTFGSITLAPGESVTLHSGSGTDSTTDVYWGRSSAVWNNGGDTVTVADGGTVVAQQAY